MHKRLQKQDNGVPEAYIQCMRYTREPEHKSYRFVTSSSVPSKHFTTCNWLMPELYPFFVHRQFYGHKQLDEWRSFSRIRKQIQDQDFWDLWLPKERQMKQNMNFYCGNNDWKCHMGHQTWRPPRLGLFRYNVDILSTLSNSATLQKIALKIAFLI